MTQEEILELFQAHGGLLSGHFLLSSGLHSNKYLQCALILQYPDVAERICTQLAKKFHNREEVNVIVSPAIGGIIVGQEVARVFKCRAVFCEREQGKMMLRRGFKIEKGEKVIIVEDVITTGGSVKEIGEIVRDKQGEVKGVGAIVNRSRHDVLRIGETDFPIVSLLKMQVETYNPEECPLCRAGIPLEKPGSRYG